MLTKGYVGNGSGGLMLVEEVLPLLEPRQMLLKVIAVGVNRADMLQAKGQYPPPKGCTNIVGLECVGEVIDTGEAVSTFTKGDIVCSLLAGGAYSDYCIVEEILSLPKPPRLSSIEAAALPEAIATAWYNLITLGQMKSGEKVCINAAAGGIGSMAVQIASQKGGHVVAIAGSQEKCEKAVLLGAERALNYREADFEQQLAEALPDGVDIAIDMVGGYINSLFIKNAAKYARIQLVGLLAGSKQELSLAAILAKSITLRGSTLRSLPLQEKAALFEDITANLLPLIHSGLVAPVVHCSLPLSQAEEAFSMMKTSSNSGKIILLSDF